MGYPTVEGNQDTEINPETIRTVTPTSVIGPKLSGICFLLVKIFLPEAMRASPLPGKVRELAPNAMATNTSVVSRRDPLPPPRGSGRWDISQKGFSLGYNT